MRQEWLRCAHSNSSRLHRVLGATEALETLVTFRILHEAILIAIFDGQTDYSVFGDFRCLVCEKAKRDSSDLNLFLEVTGDSVEDDDVTKVIAVEIFTSQDGYLSRIK